MKGVKAVKPRQRRPINLTNIKTVIYRGKVDDNLINNNQEEDGTPSEKPSQPSHLSQPRIETYISKNETYYILAGKLNEKVAP
jgi:hypothetical protein